MNPIPAIARTLFMAWEDCAALEGKTVFLRAVQCLELNVMHKTAKQWQFEQSFAPYADELRETGYPVEASLSLAAGEADTVLVMASRFAEENKSLLARAWEALRPGGWLIVSQHNDLGAKRLDGLVKQLGAQERITVTKHHCRAVAARKTEAQDDKLLQEWKQGMNAVAVPNTPLQAAPGMFSWRKVDAGSALLVECLPKTLSGKGADIAAGWGYLSWRVLEQYPNISELHLYEAEKNALDMARLNLAAQGEKAQYHWCDASRHLPKIPAGGFDWIVMNPPAHDLLGSTPEMTAAIFEQAKNALKAGGRMWLVAGRHLPYERTLESLFSQVLHLEEQGEYKVLEVVK